MLSQTRRYFNVRPSALLFLRVIPNDTVSCCNYTVLMTDKGMTVDDWWNGACRGQTKILCLSEIPPGLTWNLNFVFFMRDRQLNTEQ